MLNNDEITICTKYSILGNSYLLVQPDTSSTLSNREKSLQLDENGEPGLKPEWVQNICSIGYGIGSEGVVFGPFIRAKKATALHIYNRDGSRCNFSGNAIRMMARYILDTGKYQKNAENSFVLSVIGKDHAGLMIETSATLSFVDESNRQIAAKLNAPRFGEKYVKVRNGCITRYPPPINALDGPGLWLTVPRLSDISGDTAKSRTWKNSALVNVGNPHCVTFVDSPDLLPTIDFDEFDENQLKALSYAGTSSKYSALGAVFPDGCNLQFAFVNRKENRIVLRTFERGGGPTHASGTSSSAAAAVAYARGLTGPKVDIEMPGGEMTIDLAGRPDNIESISLQSAVNLVGKIFLSNEIDL